MERCVHKRLYNYVMVNHILTPLQSGFIQGDSTTYQLLHTYHTFCEAVDCGKEEQFFVTSVKPSTESGTGACYTNYQG